MRKIWIKAIGGCAMAAFVLGDIGAAQAQDFFSQFFNGFSRRVERPYGRMQFAPEYREDGYREGYGRSEGYGRRMRSDDDGPRYSSGGQAYCVRTCDGRYFPIGGQGEQSKSASCNNFCPSSETRVFYGSTIENASSDNGRRYSDLPNAFKYRTELVAGCTCNGTTTGLAPVKIEDDPTLKRGDIVAGADGLLVNRGSDRRGASLNFSPVSETIRAKYDRTPTVASD